MEKSNNKGGLVVGILIGIIIMLVVGIGLFATNIVSFSSKVNDKEEATINNEDNNEHKVEETTDEYDYIHTTSEKIKLNITGNYYEYAELSVQNGNLNVKTSKYNRTADGNEVQDNSYSNIEKNFTINDEKPKYIHYDYYQSGHTNVIFCLTENGNLYVNEFVANNQNVDVINNFKKMNYSNVKELVRQKNDNYGKEINGDIKDNKEYYIYALIDNELVKIDNQYQV